MISKFLWVTEFPLLEYSEEEDRYVAMHHPFTMPMEEDLPLIDTDPGKVRAKAYDIVLNGTEMGGGSVRIHQADIQEKMFEVLGFTKEKAQEQFGFDDVRKFVPQLSKENIEANRPILDLLHRFAVEKNATNAQISLAWMLHKYPNVVPIPGSKNQERILENLGAWNVTLSGDEFRQLQSALDECKVHGHRGCVETEQTSFGKQWSEETAK